ncbi:Wsc4p SKDI_08G0140 [Saccharomyces kudriavzevii IFO 1802]|uniref:WSC domain-containing protein n=1 Tax=Saccharomyces kudriavzevii (strain ATCC MYA-4449 / AS 2.2408 / CBS 8840 / NBRC 1802 / NCYC 2889) TaxID=226230 RepID=A0AA35NU38_SACK1|nr:uncharacterized protein SKDI_08G0140 [Saccharomyces kudriavzevii IFO 1802]CAI4063352.1 hypothetical protein SKDI_08G0140 [Saccharomyces kudriavzevii IFO 1802]
MQTATMNTKVNIWLVCSALCASLVRATQSVCSSQNTATTDGVREQFQSNGWCSNNCAGHQFAVVQGYMCWCSDSEPSTQTSVGNCSGACPGYGYEECGNADENLFGYIYLGQTPLSSIQSVETSTAPSTSSASISTASSSAASSSITASSTLTTLDTTSLSATTTAPVPTSTGASSSISTPTSTTSSTSTPASTTSLTSTSTSTISSTSTPTSTSSSTSTLTSTISSTSTPITFTSTSPTSTSIASSTPVSSSSASSASSSTTSSTTTSSIPASTSSTTVAYTSTTAAPTTSIITSVNLQTSLKYSVITVTSVHTMDANVSEITSRYLTTTKIITQVYSSAPTETPISVVTTTSVGVGGRITNSNGNSNSNSNNTNNNNNIPTNKSTGKKGYWHSPGKIAATFVVVGVVCLAIICVLIYLIYHYRTRPARKAQDFENAYQSKFSQSKYPNKTATATSATLHTPSPSSSSTFSTPRLIYTDEKGQITSESPSSRQSTYSLTAGSPLNDPSTLASPFRDPTLSRRASTFLHSPPTQKHHDKIESNIALGEDAVLVDQRLDPSKMLSTIASDDATNHSNISLSDNVDYSRRVLRVMNE